MSFFNLNFVLILYFAKPCFLLSSAHIISNQKPTSAGTHSSFNSKTIYHDVSNAVVCDDSERCVRIKEFSIPDNHSLNCFEYFLPIYFRDMQLGFYHPQGGIIYSKQKYLDHCRKIKRYTLNEKDLLIVIRDSIVLNEIKNADEIIEWQLFKNSEFLCWIYFKLGIYDEENDKLLLFAALKNAIFYVTILSFGKHLGFKLYFIYECLIFLTEETKMKEKLQKSHIAKKTK